MAVVCGWASQSEKRTKNGEKGDQTKKEVKTGFYYNFGQTEIIRVRNVARRKKVAKAVAGICANDNVGYGQNDRGTLFAEGRRIKWDINRIDEIRKCNGDCSEVAGCAINFAYGKEVVPSTIYTGNFHKLTVAKYPKSFKAISVSKIKNISKDLRLADMPIKAGKHIITVITR